MADFGLARRLADPSLTQHDSLLGTPRYMSPEQARTGPIDGRTDVYSLGATLYELLTLRPPFEGRTAAELVEQIGGREPVAAPAVRPADPPRPGDDRPEGAGQAPGRPLRRRPTELAEDLARFLNHEPVRARRISPLGPALAVRPAAPEPHGRLDRRRGDRPGGRDGGLRPGRPRARRGEQGRDIAKAAQATSEKAMGETKTVNLSFEPGCGNRLLHSATVTRVSTVPDRRTAGLGLLKDAARLDPEPGLRLKLRNEAVEFLVMRDVEARAPFPTGRTRGIAFGPQGTRLAALMPPDEGGWGTTIEIWDIGRRALLFEHGVQGDTGGPARREERNLGGRNGGGSGGGPRPGRGGRFDFMSLSATDESLAVVAPDFQGVRLFDPLTGTRLNTLKIPGAKSTAAILVPPSGQRFVTFD